MAGKTNKTCFVISPIGKPESDTRKRSDQIMRNIIRPAVEEKGYEAIRADEISEPGIITNQIIQHVVDDALVIADLTEHNPNVFYELAVRHVFRKPFIQIIKIGEDIPFDVAAQRTVLIDSQDPVNGEEAKNKIIEQITYLEGDSPALESPISVALDSRRHLRSSFPGASSLDPSQVLPLVYATVTGDEFIETMPLLLSFTRQDAPWVYDLGMEGYKRVTCGDVVEGQRFFSQLVDLIDLVNPIINVEPELHMLLMKLRDVLRSVSKR